MKNTQKFNLLYTVKEISFYIWPILLQLQYNQDHCFQGKDPLHSSLTCWVLRNPVFSGWCKSLYNYIQYHVTLLHVQCRNIWLNLSLLKINTFKSIKIFANYSMALLLNSIIITCVFYWFNALANVTWKCVFLKFTECFIKTLIRTPALYVSPTDFTQVCSLTVHVIIGPVLPLWYFISQYHIHFIHKILLNASCGPPFIHKRCVNLFTLPEWWGFKLVLNSLECCWQVFTNRKLLYVRREEFINYSTLYLEHFIKVLMKKKVSCSFTCVVLWILSDETGQRSIKILVFSLI